MTAKLISIQHVRIVRQTTQLIVKKKGQLLNNLKTRWRNSTKCIFFSLFITSKFL